MQVHVDRGLRIREEWLLMQQEDQAGPLSELKLDRASSHDGLRLSQEVRREVRAEERSRTRHGTLPVGQAIVASIQGLRSLPMAVGKPYSYF